MMTWFDPYFPFLALSRSPGSARPSLQHDLEQIERARITHVICLQEAFELDLLDESLESRRQTVESLGIVFTHEPIEDFNAPTVVQAKRILDIIMHHHQLSQKVLVHCQAGLGRAGTIAACALCQQGFNSQGAIAMVRYIRPGAIQSQAQEDFVAQFHTLTLKEC